MFLFTADTEFLVYMDGRNAVPTQEIRGRDGLRPVFENLSTYEATTHFARWRLAWCFHRQDLEAYFTIDHSSSKRSKIRKSLR
jgi:hypothetical protein